METSTGAAQTHEVSGLEVALEMFNVYGAELLVGRPFTAADLGAANVAIVNRTFARQLGEDSPLGRRFRYTNARRGPAAWYEIVGIVRDFPSFSPAPGSDGEPTVYHPTAPGDLAAPMISVRFSGGIPDGVAERFRQIGAQIDPALQLRRTVPLSTFYEEVRILWRYLAWAIGLVTTSVLLLSAAGIYALLSFTVAQRTREIGIRAALGAGPRRLLLSIFGRVARQIALGMTVGSVLAIAIFLNTDLTLRQAAGLLLTVAAIMSIVGLVAALGPARRSLRIQAVDALKQDG